MLTSKQMQPKTSIKFLIENSLKGNFRNVFSDINSKSVNVDTHNAIKIVVGICNFCYKNSSTVQNVNESDMMELVKCLLKLIHVPNNQEFESYAQSVFYILKLLIDKENLDYIIQLKEMFIPVFMPLILTDKHFSIYQSICKTIYNAIIRTTQSNKTQKNMKKALKLCYLLSDLYKRLDKKSALFESGHNCILALATQGAPPSDLLHFYQHITIDRIDDLSLYPSIINNLSLMYTYLLRSEECALAQSCYKSTNQNLLTLFKGKEFILLSDILTIVEWLNPVNINEMSTQIPEKAHTSLKNYHRTYSSTKNLQSVCDFISSAAFAVLQLQKKTKQWIERIEVHSDFYKFMNDVALIMSKTKYSCHCKSCPTETNLNEALRTLNTIGGFGRLCITSKDEISRTYKMEILRYLEKYIDYMMVLKDNTCEKWKKYWYDVGVHLYSIGIHFYQKKDIEMLILYLQRFVRTLLEVEGFQPKIVERTYLSSALNTIADSYYDSRDYEKCLLVTALSIILSDSPKNEINRWVRAKAASRDNSIEQNTEIQELTLVSICDKYPLEMETYVPQNKFQLSTKRKIELLVYELRQYNAKWKSKIPMSTVFKELSKIGSSQLSAEVFIEIWGDGDMSVHESLPKLLQHTIRRMDFEDTPKKNLLLAHLYFLQHKYRVKDVIVKHCDEMEKTMNLTKTSHEVVNGLVPSDPNDECDLVSSYESLKLSRYLGMMKELNTSLDLSRDWIAKNNTDDCDQDRLYKLLTNIGHEFSLHSHSVNSLQAWELALKVAKSPLQKLQAVGFLIEMADVRKLFVQKMIQDAESGITALIADKNYEELIVYFLCKTEACFYVDFDTASATFRQLLEFHREHQGSHLLRGRIHLLQHKFNMLPCRFEVEGHQEYSLVKIHQANNAVNLYYNQTPSISAYDMRIFFDIYESLAKMYHDLRLPREVRCYAKEAVVIAQKMLLPLRTTSLLYYLAYADIRTCRLNDCRVKIKDFSDILGLSKHKQSVAASAEFEGKPLVKLVDNLVGEFNEMVLDVPERVRSTPSGSPTFAAETFKCPFFLSHEECCQCFYCTSVEYHVSVLKKTYLNALLYEHEKKISLARDFYHGGINIYEYFRKEGAAYLKKIERKIPCGLVPDIVEKMTGTHCQVLLEYGNFLIRNKRYAEAESVNKNLLEKIEGFSLRFVYLYNEVLMQKLNILARSPDQAPVCSEIKVLSVDDANAKTPSCQKSKVLISPTYNQSGSKAAVKIKPISLTFDLSDNEEEATESKRMPQPKNLPLPFLNIGAKTPAPSKIKIYSEKCTKKTKCVLVEIPPFKGPEVATDEPSTPSVSSKVDNQLASRTKLLTERLKNSSRKGATSTADENVKSEVRQNLMSQLNDAIDSKQITVRRSARNRK